MKGMRKETEKGDCFILCLCMGICVPVCICVMAAFLAKCLLHLFSSEGFSGSAYSGSPGCARRAGEERVCALCMRVCGLDACCVEVRADTF